MINFDDLLRKVVEKEASDLFLRVNASPRARIRSKVQILEDNVLSKDQMTAIINFLLATQERKNTFTKNWDIDFIYPLENVGRFRVNIFMQRGTPAAVIRHVARRAKTFEELALPSEVLKKFCEEPQGLVLLCGPAGNGKSTAIASMIEHINANYEKHIMTIEDPIEFLFTDKKSIINQRDLGLDVKSYPIALRYITQQSPDVIFIGTIRDPETMRAAISAAELGALVISTFHTVNVVQTIFRIINFFPPHLHNELRMQLSLILKGIMSLRLLSRKGESGRIPAYEVMVLTPTIARLIREGDNIKEIQHFINEGGLFGMQTFQRSMMHLVNQGLVEAEEARRLADSRDEFDLEIKGIKRIGEK